MNSPPIPIGHRARKRQEGAPVGAPGRRFTDLGSVLASLGVERDWLFRGAVEGTPIGVWAGPEKRDKSWAMIAAAIACATGGVWLGAFPCERRGPVLYLDGEYGSFEFARRFARVCRGAGHDPAAIAPLVHHYYSTDLWLSHDNDAVRWILEQSLQVSPVLIVVDPWRNHLPGDENSAQDTLAALSICSQLREKTGAVVLVVHHLNKAGVQSGSRALMTRCDLIFEGSDEDTPFYATRGRTLRRADPVHNRFAIAVDHEDDEDDTVAKTFVRLRFEGEAHAATGGLSKPALRVLAVLREAKTSRTHHQLRADLGNVNHNRIKGFVGELVKAKHAVIGEDGKVSLSTSEFFQNLEVPGGQEGNGDGPF